MTDGHSKEQIESLEERLMHLEASLDEMTRTLLTQQKQLDLQDDLIKRLETIIKGLADGGAGDPAREPPPPHY